MPELPEVETVVRGLSRIMEGEVLSHVETRRDKLRFPIPQNFADILKGKRVKDLSRRAKFGLIHMEDAPDVIFHLGMSGRMRLLGAGAPEFEKHDHVIFQTGKGEIIAFNDPRRFGFIDFLKNDGSHPMLDKLGPEPLSNHFNGPALAEKLKGKKSPIKAAILDQSVVSGVGNIYACEALYEAGISPRRLAHTVQGQRAERLATTIREVLTRAIAAGGSTLKDYAQVDGELGYFQHDFRVYGREGEACRNVECGADIKRLVQSGRSTFYCSKCQR